MTIPHPNARHNPVKAKGAAAPVDFADWMEITANG
jgi:hypothetical protein